MHAVRRCCGRTSATATRTVAKEQPEMNVPMLRSVLDLSNPTLSIGAQNNIANAQVPSRNGLLLNAVP